jgi:anthranilate phosphoribosyltransferase
MADPSLHLTTKATLLTAMMLLPINPDEQEWLTHIASDIAVIPEPIRWILGLPPRHPFEDAIQQIIQHKDLSESEAFLWFEALFDPDLPDPTKAAFLEGLRLKRETDIENLAALDACNRRTHITSVDVPYLIDIANAYDGYNRNVWLAPFVACVLAAMGHPTVLHGMDEVSPKKGVNTAKVLAAANKSAPDLMRHGWAYVDQSQFNPELYGLKTLRINMVKRPVLATVEKLLLPVRAQQNYLVTGYTHPPYKSKTVSLIAQQPVDQALIVRGIEGSTQLALDRRTPFNDDFVRPEDFGFQTVIERIEPDFDLAASDSVRAGVDALNGVPGRALDMILYQAAAITRAFDLEFRDTISDGRALEKWTAV